MRILQEKGGLTTQQKDNQVRERVWEIAQPMSITNMVGAGPEQWDLLIDHCITRISHLASKIVRWKRYMADKTILDGYSLKAALDEFTEVGLHQRKKRIHNTLTKKKKFVHIGNFLIPAMRLSQVSIMFTYRRPQGGNVGSKVFTYTSALQRLKRCPCRAI